MIVEFFGVTHDFEYNIGDKLYEFAIISYENFDELKNTEEQIRFELFKVLQNNFTIKKCENYLYL